MDAASTLLPLRGTDAKVVASNLINEPMDARSVKGVKPFIIVVGEDAIIQWYCTCQKINQNQHNLFIGILVISISFVIVIILILN